MEEYYGTDHSNIDTYNGSVLSCIISRRYDRMVGKTTFLRDNTQVIYTHPEMFDENGHLVPDEILALRIENNYDINTTEETEEE